MQQLGSRSGQGASELGGAFDALPEPPADLAPLLDVERLLWTMLAALAALVLLFLWVLWKNRRRPASTSPSPAPLATDPIESNTLADRILALEQKTVRSGDYRAGCHALARLVREELSHRLGIGRRSLALTALEISAASPAPAIDDLARDLRNARFGREAPRRRTFSRLCKRAAEALGLSEDG